jgi:hypothetical protein
MTTYDWITPALDLRGAPTDALREAHVIEERLVGFPLVGELMDRGACHASVTMALLSADMIEATELVLGRPITVCPPALSMRLKIWHARPMVERMDKGPDARVIVKVAPNPRLPTTNAWQRYRVLRVGLTVGQAIRRGVLRRDIRQCLDYGWISLREPARVKLRRAA